ncbi:MAG: hypothetical protein KC546_20140 [Anaerolineae bacterium]|nr:hypothetical protein [Anaerolineae bacterium]MCA9890705.1 hypothetical protein [Anaerolineae bacterium]MCA9895973.1 hypothetical protein [Anaerolineae bacterium]MCB9459086.1 hypothetical protein [Anaerolineaceae bacterium]
MSDITTDQLRTLLRLVAPLRELKKSVEHSLHLDTFRGTSKLIVKNYSSLQKSVASIIGDDYSASLALDLDADATERETVSQVSMAAGQLLAYLVSYTGAPDSSDGSTLISTAPQITINASGTTEENKERIMNLVRDALKEEKSE